jgi:Cu2+-exporting ATPase
MSEALDLSVFIVRSGEGSARIEFAVEGVTSPSAIAEIEGALASLPGLTRARLNYTNHRVAVEWTGDTLDPAEIVRRLAERGYRAHPFEPARAEQDEQRHQQWLLRCLGVAGFAMMNIMLLAVSVWAGNVTDITPETRDFFHWLAALIALPAAGYAGQPFFRSAVAALRSGRLNMDVPISLGVLLALTMSVFETLNHAAHTYFDSAVMLLFFLLCGRFADQTMRRRTRAVAGNLAALKAEVAHRFSPTGELILVPVAALAAGDRVAVRPGERVPVDGTVVQGASDIDESLITGETALRRIAPGSTVYAGTINHGGLLSVEVVAAGSATLLTEIETLLERASAARFGYVRLADRAARLYAPVVHTAAALTLIGWYVSGAGLHYSIITAISVLIITCPCALALAVPAVQMVASGALFRAGVFLNSGEAIERLAAIDTVVFDKTGTLTLPEPRVANAGAVHPVLMAVAARLALSSHHPLASAIAAAGEGRTPFEDVEERSGEGVRATIRGIEARLGSPAFCAAETSDALPGTSLVAVRYGGRHAVLEVRQALRPDAVALVADLRARGLAVEILSGDRPEAVEPIATVLGVERWAGGARPNDKIAHLESLKTAGRRVLMVGDGINDAPALAAAHVSISPISAADIAQAHADAVFLGDRLMPVGDAIRISSKARGLMKGNLWLAVVYNTVAVPLAICGLPRLARAIGALPVAAIGLGLTCVGALALAHATGGRMFPVAMALVGAGWACALSGATFELHARGRPGALMLGAHDALCLAAALGGVLVSARL